MTSTLIGMTRKPIRFGKCRSALNSVAYPHNILTTTSYTHAQSVNSVTIPRRSFNQTFKCLIIYSQVIKSNGTLYVSGLIGVDEETGVFVSDSTADQTMQALTNLKKVLEQSGSSVQHVTKAKILLSNFDDLPLVNQIYSECKKA
ncbi:intermediate deaminase [Acrasis kona]|uniref:Intermediate deaminase n=1 Tax=Acrasis kona TaxID=1008807 RepID=A0AAW2YPI0_9EUKA